MNDKEKLENIFNLVRLIHIAIKSLKVEAFVGQKVST